MYNNDIYIHYRYVPDEGEGLLYNDTCAEAEGWNYIDIEQVWYIVL